MADAVFVLYKMLEIKEFRGRLITFDTIYDNFQIRQVLTDVAVPIVPKCGLVLTGIKCIGILFNSGARFASNFTDKSTAGRQSKAMDGLYK